MTSIKERKWYATIWNDMQWCCMSISSNDGICQYWYFIHPCRIPEIYYICKTKNNKGVVVTWVLLQKTKRCLAKGKHDLAGDQGPSCRKQREHYGDWKDFLLQKVEKSCNKKGKIEPFLVQKATRKTQWQKVKEKRRGRITNSLGFEF